MTTIAAPQERTPRVLRAGALGVLLTTTITVVLAALISDAAGVRAALLGGGMVLVFFAFGAVVVGTAARLAPGTAILVALMTYTLQVLLVGLVFAALTTSDAFDASLREGWLAAALIAGTFSWMGGQLLATLRTPVPPWKGASEGQVSAKEVGAA